MALAATMQWDVRSSGADTNSGGFDPGVTSPGTDYSQQNAPEVSYTDLVIGATTTTCTSAGTPFTSAHVGNTIKISAGTGFTVQTVEILSVAAGVATCDKSLGTTASTGGTGALGGAKLTPGAALGLAVSGNTIHVKTGTYTASNVTFPASLILTLRGYGSTHNDGGSRPTFDIVADSNNIVLSSATVAWIDNIIITRSSGGTHFTGILGTNSGSCDLLITNCLLENRDWAIYADASSYFMRSCVMINCEVTGCGQSGFPTGALQLYNELKMFGCYFHGNYTDFEPANVSPVYINANGCVFAGCTKYCMQIQNSAGSLHMVNCAFYAWGTSALHLSFNGLTNVGFINCVFYATSTAKLFESGDGTNALMQFINCAWPSALTNQPNTTGYPSTVIGLMTITGDPFTAGGSGDFSLNATAGEGAACKGAGYSGSLL